MGYSWGMTESEEEQERQPGSVRTKKKKKKKKACDSQRYRENGERRETGWIVVIVAAKRAPSPPLERAPLTLTASETDYLPLTHTHAPVCAWRDHAGLITCIKDTHTHTESSCAAVNVSWQTKERKGHSTWLRLPLSGRITAWKNLFLAHKLFIFFLPPHHFLFSLQISLTHIAFCYIRLHCHNTHRSFKHAHTNIKSGVGLEPLHRFMFLLRHFFTILAFVWHSSFDYGRTGNVLIYCKSKPALECDKIAIINMGFYILTFSGKGKKKI